MAETAADAQTELAMLWCASFSEADYPKCLRVARDMIEQAERERLEESMFGWKSLAQSLHFMGQHDEARRVALRVRREATGYLAYSNVHPNVSMGIVLARIAFLEGHSDEAAEIAGEVLARSRRDNQIANCQALALASLPIAIWNGDEDLARRLAHELVDEAEANQLNYWGNWGRQLLRALDLQFGRTGDDHANLNVDEFDALLADHIATVDDRAISQLVLRRVLDGTVGWSAPEILRIQATTTIWYDPVGARRLLNEARAVAERQGAQAWLRRVETAEASMAMTFRPSAGHGHHANP